MTDAKHFTQKYDNACHTFYEIMPKILKRYNHDFQLENDALCATNWSTATRQTLVDVLSTLPRVAGQHDTVRRLRECLQAIDAYHNSEVEVLWQQRRTCVFEALHFKSGEKRLFGSEIYTIEEVYEYWRGDAIWVQYWKQGKCFKDVPTSPKTEQSVKKVKPKKEQTKSTKPPVVTEEDAFAIASTRASATDSLPLKTTVVAHYRPSAPMAPPTLEHTQWLAISPIPSHVSPDCDMHLWAKNARKRATRYNQQLALKEAKQRKQTWDERAPPCKEQH